MIFYDLADNNQSSRDLPEDDPSATVGGWSAGGVLRVMGVKSSESRADLLLSVTGFTLLSAAWQVTEIQTRHWVQGDEKTAPLVLS